MAKNKNILRDLIVTSIEMSKRSGLPVLFMSNPGLGKTTTIYNYAKANGYYLESLIASRYSNEDISGYMVNNGGESLKVIQPEWFARIWQKEKEGVPTILFLDEISTAPDLVQGALLQLIFERTIGNGNKLPDSTLLLSAANYKQNLPPMFNIMSPAINRFVLVNLNSVLKPADLISEFTQNEADIVKKMPKFKDEPWTDEQANKCRKNVSEFFLTLANNYKSKGNSKGFLDFANTSYDDIYDTEGDVHNFISGRTISYVTRMTQAILQMGLKDSDPAIREFLLGLIGRGTNNFNEEQLKSYQSTAIKLYKKMLAACQSDSDFTIEASLDFSKDTITDAIKRWETYYESSNFAVDSNLVALHDLIINKTKAMFDDYYEEITKMEKDDVLKANFMAEVESFKRVFDTIKNIEVTEDNKDGIVPMIANFEKVQKMYDITEKQLTTEN